MVGWGEEGDEGVAATNGRCGSALPNTSLEKSLYEVQRLDFKVIIRLSVVPFHRKYI